MYTAPKITELGDATELIQGTKPIGSEVGSLRDLGSPSYELDE